VALAWDTECGWVMEQTRYTSADLSYADAVRDWHAALWRAGVVCDVARLGPGLAGYRLVLAPGACLLPRAAGAALREYVAAGGHLVMGYFGAVVDGDHHAYLGGTPGGLLDVFGIRVEECCPLPHEGSVALSFVAAEAEAGGTEGDAAWTGAGAAWTGAGTGGTGAGAGRIGADAAGTVWSERMCSQGAEAVATYASGPLAGLPAVTRHAFGQGVAWYVSTRLDGASRDRLLRRVLAEAGAEPVVPGLPAGVEAVRRRGDGRSWLFLLNHTESAAVVPARGVELLADRPVAGEIEVGPGEVAVIREDPPPG
jgi:beta-galactosidase